MTAPATPLSESLYCLDCAYNLRGLTGAIIRCPECGIENDLEVIRDAAHPVRKKLKELEGAVAWSAVFLVILVGPIWLVALDITWLSEPVLWWVVVPTTGFLFTSILAFRDTCEHKTDWFRMLLLYWLAAFTLPAGLIAPLFLFVFAAQQGSLIAGSFYVIGAFLVFGATLSLTRVVHRWLQKRLHPMQRAVALRMLEQQNQ